MINWSNVTRKLSELVPWDVNPKQLTEVQAGHLQTSIRKFGLALPFLISPENDMYDGHQRRQLLRIMKEYGQDVDIPCRMSSRILTEDERRELVVRLHENTGEWDWDMVPNLYDVEELGEWGMPEWKIEEFLPEDEPDGNYSRKIEAPTYLPSNEKPAIGDLYDDSKTVELIAEIDSSDIGEDEKQLLRVAAQRHTVLRFDRIADYYAHSDEQVQYLMENSALVIIDFEKAIELGYVKLTEAIAEMVRDEYGDE